MKVYLAARYPLREIIKGYKEELESIGVEVTSRWLNERKPTGNGLNDFSPKYLREHAQMDKEDIEKCDVLVLFTEDPEAVFPRGGRHHEAGYADGLGKRIVLCGPRENIFHYLSDYVQCNDFAEVKHYLEYLGS